jgi:hypothetical protein
MKSSARNQGVARFHPQSLNVRRVRPRRKVDKEWFVAIAGAITLGILWYVGAILASGFSHP